MRVRRERKGRLPIVTTPPLRAGNAEVAGSIDVAGWCITRGRNNQ